MKIRSKGVVKGSRDLILGFWHPLHISGTLEAKLIDAAKLFCSKWLNSGDAGQ